MKRGVLVRTPMNKSLNEIKKIVDDKKQWIFKKQLEFSDRKKKMPKIAYSPGTMLPYLGKKYPFELLLNQKKEGVSFRKKKFIILLKSKFSKALIQKLYEDWLWKKSKSIFESKVAKYSKKLGIKTPKFVIKKLKGRWGSATQNNVINLNMHLLKAPDDVIDYVILHEFCHFEIKEHNHHFWNKVGKYMPEYSDKKRWLEIQGQRIV